MHRCANPSKKKHLCSRLVRRYLASCDIVLLEQRHSDRYQSARMAGGQPHIGLRKVAATNDPFSIDLPVDNDQKERVKKGIRRCR